MATQFAEEMTLGTNINAQITERAPDLDKLIKDNLDEFRRRIKADREKQEARNNQANLEEGATQTSDWSPTLLTQIDAIERGQKERDVVVAALNLIGATPSKIAKSLNLKLGEFTIIPLPDVNGSFGGTLVHSSGNERYLREDYLYGVDRRPADEASLVIIFKHTSAPGDGLENAQQGERFLAQCDGKNWTFKKLPQLGHVSDEFTKQLYEKHVPKRKDSSNTPDEFEVRTPGELKLTREAFAAYVTFPHRGHALLTAGSDEVPKGIIIQFGERLDQFSQGEKISGTITKDLNGNLKIKLNTPRASITTPPATQKNKTVKH